MPPPAKRRKRNAIDESDDEESAKLGKAHTNTLANYVQAPNSTVSRLGSAGRVRSSPRRKATRRGSSATASPVKTRPSRPRKKLNADESTTQGVRTTENLLDLFSRQAKRSAESAPGKEEKLAHVEDLTSDPISEADELSELKSWSSSVTGQKSQKRFKKGLEGVAVDTKTPKQRFVQQPKPSVVEASADDLRPWAERFGPRSLEELAVHQKKVADVRNWLAGVFTMRSKQSILVMKGAAGSGKTTTIRLLAQSMGCELLEWKNPSAISGSGYISISAQFDDFITRGGVFGSLDVEPGDSLSSTRLSSVSGKNSKKIILIEEFPNTFSRASSILDSFRSTLKRYLGTQGADTPSTDSQPGVSARTPIVLVISETLLTTTSASADSFTAHRLLGPEILAHPQLREIEFNPIAPSLLTKALELIVKKESRTSGRKKTPGPLVLQRLGEVGDIRNATASLEFLCLKGDQTADWGAKVRFAPQRRGAKSNLGLTEYEAESLEMISRREASLGIFHAVGKVVYNKRDEVVSDDRVEELSGFLSHVARPERSQVSADRLIDEIGTDTQTFISALHENYVLSCESSDPMDLSTSMDYVQECIEYLSLADLLSPSRDIFSGGWGSGRDMGSQMLRQDEMTFHVAVRGMLFSLPNPVKRKPSKVAKGGDAFKMFYPTSLKLWRAKEEMEGLINVWSARTLHEGDGLGSEGVAEGAGAYRKPLAASGPSSWMQRQQKAQASVQQAQKAKEENDEPSPPLSLGCAARREMLLERLPYMALIAHGRGPSARLRELDKIVAFRGVAAIEEASDAEDEPAPAETWATDKPSEEVGPGQKSAGIRSAAMSGLLAQKLVLSDDDIED